MYAVRWVRTASSVGQRGSTTLARGGRDLQVPAISVSRTACRCIVSHTYSTVNIAGIPSLRDHPSCLASKRTPRRRAGTLGARRYSNERWDVKAFDLETLFSPLWATRTRAVFQARVEDEHPILRRDMGVLRSDSEGNRRTKADGVHCPRRIASGPYFSIFTVTL